MPTYDYACENCGHKWDVEQRMSEDPIRKCPKCGKLKARRQITGGNFILKGSGWYSDLYSSAKPAAKKSESETASSPASSDTKSESKSEGKSEAKSESKPEGKSESKPTEAKPSKKKAASD